MSKINYDTNLKDQLRQTRNRSRNETATKPEFTNARPSKLFEGLLLKARFGDPGQEGCDRPSETMERMGGAVGRQRRGGRNGPTGKPSLRECVRCSGSLMSSVMTAKASGKRFTAA